MHVYIIYVCMYVLYIYINMYIHALYIYKYAYYLSVYVRVFNVVKISLTNNTSLVVIRQHYLLMTIYNRTEKWI